jgi:hypothetical protein
MALPSRMLILQVTYRLELRIESASFCREIDEFGLLRVGKFLIQVGFSFASLRRCSLRRGIKVNWG